MEDCNKERKIGFIIKYTIKLNLKNVRDFLPISKDNLKKEYHDLYDLIRTWGFETNKPKKKTIILWESRGKPRNYTNKEEQKNSDHLQIDIGAP